MQWTLFAVNQANWAPLVWSTLGVIGALGLLAVLSPTRFSALSNRGSQWVDTSKVLTALDKRIDVDQLVLPYSRILGAAVLMSVAVIGFLFERYF